MFIYLYPVLVYKIIYIDRIMAAKKCERCGTEAKKVVGQVEELTRMIDASVKELS